MGLGHNKKILNIICRPATSDERSDIIKRFLDLTFMLQNLLFKIVFSFCLTEII